LHFAGEAQSKTPDNFHCRAFYNATFRSQRFDYSTYGHFNAPATRTRSRLPPGLYESQLATVNGANLQLNQLLLAKHVFSAQPVFNFVTVFTVTV
jgi:hypothetical protein